MRTQITEHRSQNLSRGFALDADGNLDLVAVRGTHVQWFPRVGELSFGAGTSLTIAGRYESSSYHRGAIAIADFDGDGALDIAAVKTADGLSVLRNNGGGATFTKADYLGGGGTDVEAADFNGDGHIDLALHNNGAVIFLNRGDGTFSTPTVIGLDNYQWPRLANNVVFAKDMDGDGDLDLVSLNPEDSSLAVIRNNGSRSFTLGPRIAIPGEGALAGAANDLDGDGDADVVVGGYSGLTILRNNGSGELAFVSTTNLPNHGVSSVAVGRIDGDGLVDIVVGNGTSVLVFRNQGDAHFAEPLIIDIGAFVGELVLSGQRQRRRRLRRLSER